MINASKKADTRQWNKWKKNGAVETPPQVVEQQEKEAEKWLKQRYHFDVSKLPKQLLDQLTQDLEQGYAERVSYSRSDVLKKIQDYPTLNLEEIKSENDARFGTTNNFWCDFFFDTCNHIKKDLDEGHLPRDFGDKQLLYWYIKGILLQAFNRVGFERIKRMHQALETFLMLDREWKRRIGDHPGGLLYGINFIPKSLLISDKERRDYIQSYIEVTNTLRLLALELVKEGVPFSAIHR